MKFRAVCNAPSAQRELHAIIATLARIHKEATLILQPDSLQFIVAENCTQGTPWLWSDVSSAAALFAEYHLEGVDRLLHNRIVLQLNAVKLCGALSALNRGASSSSSSGGINQSTAPVRYVKLKLTNRQFPCLSVELEVPSSAGLAHSAAGTSSIAQPYRRVTHDVPVQLVAVRDWHELEVPRNRRAELQLMDDRQSFCLPSQRSLRTLVDRIKNLSPSLTVYYNGGGELALVVETDLATVASHYKNLATIGGSSAAAGSATTDSSRGDVSCRVSSKQLAMILGSLQLPLAGGMWCRIEQDAVMELRAEIRPQVTVNCMINVVAL